MYHFTNAIQYVYKEREKQLENNNNDNDDSLHSECLLFIWHCSKPFTRTRVKYMKLPIFGRF